MSKEYEIAQTQAELEQARRDFALAMSAHENAPDGKEMEASQVLEMAIQKYKGIEERLKALQEQKSSNSGMPAEISEQLDLVGVKRVEFIFAKILIDEVAHGLEASEKGDDEAMKAIWQRALNAYKIEKEGDVAVPIPPVKRTWGTQSGEYVH